MDVVEAAAVPSCDVLPTRARRRLSRRDAWLPLVLTGELLAGVLLGMTWHVVATVPEVRPSAVGTEAGGAQRDAAEGAARGGATGGTATVVPPAAAPAPPPQPRRAEPRNPFAMQLG